MPVGTGVIFLVVKSTSRPAVTVLVVDKYTDSSASTGHLRLPPRDEKPHQSARAEGGEECRNSIRRDPPRGRAKRAFFTGSKVNRDAPVIPGAHGKETQRANPLIETRMPKIGPFWEAYPGT